MESILKTPSFTSSSRITQFIKIPSLSTPHQLNISGGSFRITPHSSLKKFHVSCTTYNGASSSSADMRRISSLESLFCYDKAIPEQIIEKPVGLSVAEKEIGDQARCSDCETKGAVLCTTCGGSGLYVDSIMESQGIIVKVRCLGCGGTGNTMCSECGGRGHL